MMSALTGLPTFYRTGTLLGLAISQETNSVYQSSSIAAKPTSMSTVYKSQAVIKGKGKAVPLHAMEALGGRGGIDPTHSRPRH
jgi:hypothetical protein